MKKNNGCKDRDAKVKKSSAKLVTKVLGLVAGRQMFRYEMIIM